MRWRFPLWLGSSLLALTACGMGQGRNNLGNTPLYQAASAGDSEEVARLLDDGAAPDAWNSFTDDVPGFVGYVLGERAGLGRRALHAAAEKLHPDVVQQLCERGADVNTRTKRNESPLWSVASSPSSGDGVDVAKVLLEAGAEVDAADEDGVTPLLAATATGRGALVALLAESGADLNQRDPDGATPLQLAAEAGRTEVVAALVRRGADVNATTRGGHNALQLAVVEGHATAVRALLRAGADPTVHAPGSSPLVVNAAFRGQTEIVRLLLNTEHRPKRPPLS